jgi:nitroimidazol reductase NimA-like FMN-containing flavoprotein (pyridoxamine 5'-phosphate oxidase superfamily)
VRERIRALAQGQPYGVLCVQGEGQPYGALVAFAFTPDLRHLVFATPRATRKFRLLSRSDRVALVVDNRPDKRGAFMEIEAVTLTGRARLVEGGEAWERWAALLLGRHPYLEAFVRAPTSALFRVETVRMLHVGRFQEVSQWVPEDPS